MKQNYYIIFVKDRGRAEEKVTTRKNQNNSHVSERETHEVVWDAKGVGSVLWF